MRETKLKRINELVQILNDASRVYYQENNQSMSDKEYDLLAEELERLESETGYVHEDSPTYHIGHEVVSSLVKVTHKSPMMSLDKTKETAKMLEFLGNNSAIMSLKLDGLAIELTYTDGALSQAVTRGNGLVGENITHNARNFVNLPERINYAGELRVRGEAVISFADFELINQDLEEKYKNPRNLCSGTVRQLDNKITKTRSVHFLAYSVSDLSGFKKKSDMLKMLAELGFEVVKYRVVSAENFMETLRAFKDGLAASEYATDGLVMSYDDVEFSRSLGHTSKFPKDSLAFKWADEEAETNLIRVEWNTSRTGLINPVAVFKPVEIEGTTVERASLHNLSIFEELAPGENDAIMVYKANMIIPQVSKNLTRSNTFTYPTQCPSCGEDAQIRGDNTARTLFCSNQNCPARVVSAIAHYASRDAMNIEGLSEQTIARFHELGYLNTYADLYTLREHEDELSRIKGFGKQSITKILSAIDASKTCNLHNFINTLGIPNVGKEYAKLLCAHYNNDLERIRNASFDELIMIHGFGEAIARAVYEYFSNPQNFATMEAVLPHLSFIEEERKVEGRLSGKTFVITGDLNGYKSRRDLQGLIEREGGRVASAVSAKTDYLINNDAGSQSSKNKKAQELGVTIITEEGFNKLLV